MALTNSQAELELIKQEAKKRELIPVTIRFYEISPFGSTVETYIPDQYYILKKVWLSATMFPPNSLYFMGVSVSYKPGYSVLAQTLSYNTTPIDLVTNGTIPLVSTPDLGEDGFILEKDKPLYILAGTNAPGLIKVLGTLTLMLKPLRIVP